MITSFPSAIGHAAVLLTFCAVAAAAQGAVPDTVTRRAERIVGRVTTDSGLPLEGAVVSVTRGPDRAFQRDSTGREGRFSIVWAEGTGDYLVHVAALGHSSFRQRVRRSSASDTLFRVDVVLRPAAAQLAAVQVRAQRPTPPRGVDPFSVPIGGGQQHAEGLEGAVGPELAGDIAALASTTAGMLPLEGGGFSALGLGAEQSTVTLDGLGFSGTSLPRESRLAATVSTSPYDVSHGGFSGAVVALNFGRSSLFSRWGTSTTLDAPQLQLVDPLGRRLGQRFLDVTSSVGGTGPLGCEDRSYYSLSGELARRSADAVSLFDASGDALRAAGVSTDSAATLGQILDRLGIPRDAGGGRTRKAERGVFLAQYGWSDFDRVTRKARDRSGAVVAYMQVRRMQGLNVFPTAAATQGGSASGGTGALQGRYSHLLGRHRDRVLDVRSGVTLDRDESAPHLLLPGGRVLVGAPAGAVADGAALTNLGFGGGAGMQSRHQRWTWDTRSELQWFANADHRLKLTAQSRFDGFTRVRGANRFGTFTFNSLEDLAAGRPAAFTRVLSVPERSGGLWTGALSLGDFWDAHPRLQLVYGARIEANRYTSAPSENARVAELLGANTGFAPNRIRVSPRIGFTYRYNTGRARLGGISYSPLGQFVHRPHGYIRGGIGEFRALPSGTLLSEASATTGRAGGETRLLCVGDAVPVPAWDDYVLGRAPIPSECAGDSSPFSDAAPAVTLIDRGFDTPRSWRGNLSGTALWGRLSLVVNGIASLNMHQRGVADLNIREAPVSMLASEGGRALYVPASSIVPATGAVSPVEGRRSSEFGRVTSLRSDLRSTSRQLSIFARPDVGARNHLSVTYTWSSVREQQRGFDGAAFGDLWERETGRGRLDARHQVLLGTGRSFPGMRSVSVTLFGVFRSGLPYTPYIAGDVNGDGSSNDRAFVHDPGVAAAAGDAPLAAGMQSLLDEAPHRARGCLRQQLGRAAGRNSCEGPWSATMNARITLPWRFIPTSIPGQERMGVALYLTNPLGGIDQLIHGSSGIRGWGAAPRPDAALYTVTGFDPAAQRFRYKVNPRFGSTDPARSLTRTPFRLTLLVAITLGRPTQEQQVRKFLEPGRTQPGAVLDSAALRVRYSRSTPNVYLRTLQMADSLLLSQAQVEALEEAQKPYLARLDSLWGSLAREFAALPRDFNSAAALERQEEVVDAGWEINKDAARHIQAILSPLQFTLTQGIVQILANTKGRVTMRYY